MSKILYVWYFTCVFNNFLELCRIIFINTLIEVYCILLVFPYDNWVRCWHTIYSKSTNLIIIKGYFQSRNLIQSWKTHIWDPIKIFTITHTFSCFMASYHTVGREKNINACCPADLLSHLTSAPWAANEHMGNVHFELSRSSKPIYYFTLSFISSQHRHINSYVWLHVTAWYIMHFK